MRVVAGLLRRGAAAAGSTPGRSMTGAGDEITEASPKSAMTYFWHGACPKSLLTLDTRGGIERKPLRLLGSQTAPAQLNRHNGAVPKETYTLAACARAVYSSLTAPAATSITTSPWSSRNETGFSA